MPTIEDGVNQIVTVTIEYEDGTVEYVPMTKKQATELQDQVAARKKPGIKVVRW
jgi:hypothetical protein